MSGFESALYPGEMVIDDDNYTMQLGDSSGNIFIDGEPYGFGYVERDFNEDAYGDVAKPFDLVLVPRNEWADRIEQMEKEKSRLSDMLLQAGIPSLNQNQTNYCWANGVVTAVETLRCMMGQPYVSLSAASVAAPIKNYSNSGGWGTQALKYIIAKGIVPRELWPNDHSGINRKYDNDESRAEREKYRVTEWLDLRPRNFDQLMTCLFNRIPVPVGHNWWGHEVCAMDPVKTATGYAVRFRNSWGDGYGHKGFNVYSQSKATPDDACAPTVPIAS